MDHDVLESARGVNRGGEGGVATPERRNYSAPLRFLRTLEAMRVRQRLNRLERQAALSSKAKNAHGDSWSDEDWLARIEQEGQQGVFAHEPDFPVAFATYRQAIERAAAQSDPPFEPPADFMPNLDPHLRLSNWRNWSCRQWPNQRWLGCGSQTG